jgi:anaerobic selenocysteine-containing dehydrogenase
VAGNPVLSAPNGPRLDRAFATLEMMVCVDSYVNETTRHATVILPAVSPLERSHYDIAINAFAVRNVAKYVPAPLPSAGKQDWELLLRLGLGLRLESQGAQGSLAAWLYRLGSQLGPEGLLDVLVRLGPHGVRGRGLTLAELRKHPHGLDLGALEPRLPGILETKDKRIALAPRELLREAYRVLSKRRVEVGDSLLLIGRRHLRSNNSWMHNSQALVKGPARCTLLMHPEDANARGLLSGTVVEVRSRVGAVQVPLELSDEVMRGVVSLPHGFGHSRPGTRMRVAEAHAGVSLNDLTDDQEVDELSGNAAFSGIPVSVSQLASVTRPLDEKAVAHA